MMLLQTILKFFALRDRRFTLASVIRDEADIPEDVSTAHGRYWRRVVEDAVRNTSPDYAVVCEGTVSIGEAELATLYFLHRGDEYRALLSVARHLSTMANVEERTFFARCSSLGLDDFDALWPFCEGTIVFSRILREERRARATWRATHSDYEYGALRSGLPAAGDCPVPGEVLEIPPRVEWEHAEYGSNVPHGLPPITESWHRLMVRLGSSEPFVFRRESRARMPPPAPLEVTPVRYEHPRYGAFGHFKYPLKPFTAITNPHQWVPPTHSTAIGAHVPAVLARWDRHDPYNFMEGIAGRVARDPGTYQRELMAPYVEVAVDRLIGVLTDFGMEVCDDLEPTPELAFRWLSRAKFPGPKKEAYCRAFSEAMIDADHLVPAADMPNIHEVFLKNEGYPSADKVCRCILAGDLHMAAAIAPIVDLLGEVFFNLDFTSKRIPERERPAAAIARFGFNPVLLNDMSAFECSICADIKRDIENRVLKHFFPNHAAYIDRSTEPLSLSWHGGSARVANVRCSGDPQTSLGNSMTNIVSIWAAYLRAHHVIHGNRGLGVDLGRVTAWVEGDDSLVTFPELGGSGAPRKAFVDAYLEAFKAMGFATKMELKEFVGDAGYCSMYFTERAKNSPSVAQTFLEFPWCHGSDANRGSELLSLKACSLAAQAPGQPLTWALAQRYAPRNSTYAYIPFNAYELEELERLGYDVSFRGKLMQVRVSPCHGFSAPTPADRVEFHRRYGISPKDQVMLEDLILERGCPGILGPSGHTWSWLETLCKVDGIDLPACRRVYHHCVGISPTVPTDLAHTIVARSVSGQYSRTSHPRDVPRESHPPATYQAYQQVRRPLAAWEDLRARRAAVILERARDDPEFAASLESEFGRAPPIRWRKIALLAAAVAVMAVVAHAVLSPAPPVPFRHEEGALVPAGNPVPLVEIIGVAEVPGLVYDRPAGPQREAALDLWRPLPVWPLWDRIEYWTQYVFWEGHHILAAGLKLLTLALSDEAAERFVGFLQRLRL